MVASSSCSSFAETTLMYMAQALDMMDAGSGFGAYAAAAEANGHDAEGEANATATPTVTSTDVYTIDGLAMPATSAQPPTSTQSSMAGGGASLGAQSGKGAAPPALATGENGVTPLSAGSKPPAPARPSDALGPPPQCLVVPTVPRQLAALGHLESPWRL